MNLAIESLFLRSKPAPCVFSALRQSASVGQPPVITVTCGRTHAAIKSCVKMIHMEIDNIQKHSASISSATQNTKSQCTHAFAFAAAARSLSFSVKVFTSASSEAMRFLDAESTS